MTVHIRRAKPSDHAVLVEYNRRMAWETEQKKLDDQVLSQGVAAALADPAGFLPRRGAGRRSRRPTHDHPRMERLAERVFLVDPKRLRAAKTPAAWACSVLSIGRSSAWPKRRATSSASGCTSNERTSAPTDLRKPRPEGGRLFPLSDDIRFEHFAGAMLA